MSFNMYCAEMPFAKRNKAKAQTVRNNSAILADSSEDILFTSAAEAIQSEDYQCAKTLLRQSMSENMENPEAYNLLGICYEREGNLIKASRFYRIAYYMDQSFKPAIDNLERTSGFWYKGSGSIEWGLANKGDK